MIRMWPWWWWFDRLQPIPIPPRPGEAEWMVGTTFPPFNDEEFDYLAPYGFLYRVSPADGAQTVLDHGEDVLLLLDNANDPMDSFDVQTYVPFFGRVWAIELGNELNLEYKRWPGLVNQFYKQAISEFRAAGYTGRLITAGIMNLNDDTLRWARRTIRDLDGDIIFGWHGYSDWRDQLEKLHGILNARRHAMTECGIGLDDYEVCAHLISTGAAQVYRSGSLTYIHYQTHDGEPNTELNNFGLRTWEGMWKEPMIRVLADWTTPPTAPPLPAPARRG